MKYIIISLKHGTGDKPCFWRADNSGYTEWPFAAGVYGEEQIKSRPDYYNNGYSAIAIPLTEQAMNNLEFKCSFNQEATIHFLQTAKSPS